MERFDILVIGSGSGMTIVEGALNKGLRVALVDKDPLGGTCLNRGCVPSKMIIYPADIVQEAKRVKVLGVKASIDEINFKVIMERMRSSVSHDRQHMEESVKGLKNLTYYPALGEFVEDYRMRVNNEIIEAKNVFLVSGARPDIPPIKGIERVNYLTYRNVFDLEAAPRSMVIAGGGYIACELAHFFDTIGVEVTIVSRSPALLRHNEPEISETLTKALRTRMSILTSTEVKGVSEVGEVKEVTIVDEKGAEKTIKTESLLIAAGLRGNADLLKTEKTGVRSDDRGYIQVNNFYETSKPRIWAFGDATGRAMFKHVANWEAELVWNTFDHGHRRTLDYDKIPYAIFSWPEVGGVGITEEETIRRRLNYLVSVYPYEDTAYGSAMGDKEGFVKLLVEEKTYKILGCHIVGPQAPILIQEVIIAMNAGDGSVYPLIDSMHIHPALSEVVQRAVWHLHKPKHNQT